MQTAKRPERRQEPLEEMDAMTQPQTLNVEYETKLMARANEAPYNRSPTSRFSIRLRRVRFRTAGMRPSKLHCPPT